MSGSLGRGERGDWWVSGRGVWQGGVGEYQLGVRG